MTVTQIWYSLDEALPPLDKIKEGDVNHSVLVAIVLKSGGVCKAIRYYAGEGSSNWKILDGIMKNDEVSDENIVAWTKVFTF